jgi:hypothetical protein
VGVLVLSQYVEKTYAAKLPTGATEGTGYLLKDRVPEVADFLASLERIRAGGTVIDPEVVRQPLARAIDQPRTNPEVNRARTRMHPAHGNHHLSLARSRQTPYSDAPATSRAGGRRGIPGSAVRAG